MKKDSDGWVRISSKLQKLAQAGSLDTQGCTHINEIQDVRPQSDGCAKCLELGDTWVTLRLCLVCGHVGCCDNSKNKHATKHYHETQHPMMVSYEPGEEWCWCYVDEVPIIP
jgi:uncharacterized UBP type Zn finger protein